MDRLGQSPRDRTDKPVTPTGAKSRPMTPELLHELELIARQAHSRSLEEFFRDVCLEARRQLSVARETD